MNPLNVLRRYFANSQRSCEILEEIKQGIINQTDVVNRHYKALANLPASVGRPHQEVQAVERRASFDKSVVRMNQLAPDVIEGMPRAGGALPQVNDLFSYEHIFDGIVPYSGTPPVGYYADWLGVLTDGLFRTYLGIDRESMGGTAVETRNPILSDGEGWFEAVNQVEAARNARGHFVMVTLGACYGAQAVSSAVALRKLNPMPFKLVAVEPEPVNHEWVAKHFRDNAIDPDEHWLVKAAISDSNDPVFFPVGAPGSGAQNSFATNEAAARANYVQALIDSGNQNEALRNLLLRNTTGLKKRLIAEEGFDAEITMLSAVTLADILAPLPIVDYLEADIQQSEILVFPPFMDLVKRRVRRVHIGTHGTDVHETLAEMFRRDGWHMVFDLKPNSSHVHPLGSFDLNDGVLTAINPDLPENLRND